MNYFKRVVEYLKKDWKAYPQKNHIRTLVIVLVICGLAALVKYFKLFV